MRVALQRVVDRLRDVEELVPAVDDPPFDVEPGVPHERDERVEDLGDATAERGRREVEHPLALERRGELLDLVHEAPRGDRRVVGQELRADVDQLELHGG